MQNTISTTTKFSMSVSYDPKRRLTTVFVHGPEFDEFTILADQVRNSIENIALPTLIPTLLLSKRVGSAVQKIKDSHGSIVDVEDHTGVETNWHPGRPCCCSTRFEGKMRPGNRLHDIDFDRVTNELTSILNKMAYCEFVCNVHLPMLDDLDGLNEQIAAASTYSNDRVIQALQSLRGRNEFLRSSFKGVLIRSQYLSKRAQALVQTVSIDEHPVSSPSNTRDHADLQPHITTRECTQHAR